MPHRKILGVLGGDHMTAAKVAAWVESADIVISADGGMLRVLEAGFVPDVVIGDFDSMSLEVVGPETEAIVDRHQDNTDCGKLLDYAKRMGYSKVTLICAEGDLSDHFLDTVHCAVRSDLDVSIGLQRGIAHVLKGPVERTFLTTPGMRVSMLPLETVTKASLSGVQWEFEDATLSVRGFTSISNVATESQLKVSFEEGSGYLFIESESPDWQGSIVNPA
jgi:thiamine pyrophosphokinase